ncbi:hypothetical protein I2486_12525 [Cellulophaga sp. E16_2]|uniref:hypothetical protein n=1 Tax=Cellulophaga sp. E16_2 TaxID=2789297 RepID=UPI001A939972|nr:hypothetical protein [Cellulophaga sp. E16_2]MBO0592225.1 hypothetical protein [Cellulophaga sp. E16_2]
MGLKIKLVLLAILLSSLGFGQKKSSFEKDIDFDGVIDTVYVDRNKSKIICVLSSMKFSKIESKEVHMQVMSGISDAKNGFNFENNYMRAGYSNQFRYDPKTEKIRLIGIKFYEFCNTNSNDACGDASGNFLTGNFIGEWIYFEERDDKYIKIPMVKVKVSFKNISLEDFNEDTYFDFGSTTYEISCEARDKMLAKRK